MKAATAHEIIEPTEYGYAQANVVTKSSPMVYVSGQVGVSEAGDNDFYSQVDRSFEQLEVVLIKSGARVEDVVKFEIDAIALLPK